MQNIKQNVDPKYILAEFIKFVQENDLSSSNIQQFEQEILPKLMQTLNKGVPFSNFFKCVTEGYWKEVYLFEDYVIKFGSDVNLNEEASRKENYCNKDIFVPLYIIPLNIHIKANNRLHQPWLTYLAFQKRVKTLVDEDDKKIKLMTNKTWFYTFLDQNYSQEEKKLILSIVDSLDFNIHNIGYDENGKAVIFDW